MGRRLLVAFALGLVLVGGWFVWVLVHGELRNAEGITDSQAQARERSERERCNKGIMRFGRPTAP
jgi:hypothetical protein